MVNKIQPLNQNKCPPITLSGTDTPGWTNNGKPNGFGCDVYEKMKWCGNNANKGKPGFNSGFEWTGGKQFHYPENNCTVCGKKGILDQSSKIWKAFWENGGEPDASGVCRHQKDLHNEINCKLDGHSETTDVGPCYANGVSVLSPLREADTTQPIASAPIKTQPLCPANLKPYGDALGVLTQLNKLQDQERTLLIQLKNPNNASSENTQNAILAIQKARKALMIEVGNIARHSHCTLKADRQALQDQIAMAHVAENQLRAMEKQTQNIVNKQNNTQRMIEITNYEYDRYSSHKNIFKIIAFCSLFVLAGLYIGGRENSRFSWLGSPIIILSVAIAIFLTIHKIYTNYTRDETNWNQFVWDSPYSNKDNNDTVWQHDKKAFGDLLTEGDNEIKSAYGTVKSDVNTLKSDVASTANKITKKVRGTNNQ